MPKSQSNDTILVIEAGSFEKKVGQLLSLHEQRGLQLVLAENPFSGQPSVVPEVMEIAWAGCRVLYLVRSDATKIYLVDIESEEGDGTPDAQEQSAIRKTLEAVAPTLGIAIAKEGAKWLWNLLKHYL